MAGPLQFVPFITSIEHNFWTQLNCKKLDELKLDDRPLPLSASFTNGLYCLLFYSGIILYELDNFISLNRNLKSVAQLSMYHISLKQSSSTADCKAGLPTHVSLSYDSFAAVTRGTPYIGEIVNKNTVEEFKDSDFTGILNGVGKKVIMVILISLSTKV